jgi:hypothetical protein
MGKVTGLDHDIPYGCGGFRYHRGSLQSGLYNAKLFFGANYTLDRRLGKSRAVT